MMKVYFDSQMMKIYFDSQMTKVYFDKGLYIIEEGNWVGKSKGLEMGKGKERGKKRKKENLGKI